MILNMSNGGTKAQHVVVTLVSDATDILIPTVEVAGGIIKGLALMKDDDDSYALRDRQILYAYADQTQSISKEIIQGVYYSTDTSVHRIHILSPYGFDYNVSTQVLTIHAYTNDFFGAGKYSLLVW